MQKQKDRKREPKVGAADQGHKIWIKFHPSDRERGLCAFILFYFISFTFTFPFFFSFQNYELKTIWSCVSKKLVFVYSQCRC